MASKVDITFDSTFPHNSQLLTGLELLRKNGEINLTYRLKKKRIPSHMVHVSIDGKQCIFDFADHSMIENEYYEQSDFYIKRMLLKSDLQRHPRLIPYGLNYSVMTENKFIKYLFLRDIRLLKFSIRYHRFISKMLGITDSLTNVDVAKFFNIPNKNGKIVFRARLWNPSNNPTLWKKEERKILNDDRIEIMRMLKSTFPKEFIGGIEEDSYSKERCPDLVIPKNMSSKRAYLNILKSSVIGIANQGLEGSIGWKLPEYLAHGMAVLTTPISQFVLHGDFEEGKNYLSFNDTDSCLKAVNELMSNSRKRWEMQQSNARYYQEYLHPAAKMREIIRLMSEKS